MPLLLYLPDNIRIKTERGRCRLKSHDKHTRFSTVQNPHTHSITTDTKQHTFKHWQTYNSLNNTHTEKWNYPSSCICVHASAWLSIWLGVWLWNATMHQWNTVSSRPKRACHYNAAHTLFQHMQFVNGWTNHRVCVKNNCGLAVKHPRLWKACADCVCVCMCVHVRAHMCSQLHFSQLPLTSKSQDERESFHMWHLKQIE